MTDRYVGLTVALDKDYREDDAEKIIEAIKMVKGVLDVQPAVMDPAHYFAETRVRADLIKKLWDALRS